MASVVDKKIATVLMLPDALKTCSYEEFKSSAGQWIKTLLSVMNHSPSASTFSLCTLNIGRIMQRADQHDEIHKEISVNVVPTLLALAIRNSTDEDVLEACCHLIHYCLLHYPTSCASRKSAISRVCLQCVDNTQCTTSVTSLACKILALLPLSTSAGRQGVKHADSWTDFVLRVIELIDDNIDKCLYGEEQQEDDEQDETTQVDQNQKNQSASELLKFQSPTSDMNEHAQANLFLRRLQCMFQVLTEMLSHRLRFVVQFPMDIIIALICKISNLSAVQDLSQHILNKFLSGPYLQICQSMLHLLTVMTSQLKTNLLPHAGVIWKVSLKCLHDSKLHTSNKTRVAFYQLVCTWTNQIGNLPSDVIEVTSKSALSDIEIENITTNNLLMSSQVTSQIGQKRKKGKNHHLQAEVMKSEQQKKHTDPQHNSDVCYSALQCLLHVVNTCAPSMMDRVLVEIVERVISTIASLYCTSGLSCTSRAPYGEHHCRLKLVNLMEAVMHTGNHKVAIPMTLIMSLLTTCQRADPSPQVTTACQLAVMRADTVIHNTHQPYVRRMDTYAFTGEGKSSREERAEISYTTAGSVDDFSEKNELNNQEMDVVDVDAFIQNNLPPKTNSTQPMIGDSAPIVTTDNTFGELQTQSIPDKSEPASMDHTTSADIIQMKEQSMATEKSLDSDMNIELKPTAVSFPCQQVVIDNANNTNDCTINPVSAVTTPDSASSAPMSTPPTAPSVVTAGDNTEVAMVTGSDDVDAIMASFVDIDPDD